MKQVWRPAFGGIVVVAAAVAIVIASGGLLTADTPVGLRASADSPVAGPLTQKLPPVAKAPMTVTRSGEALSVLSFDDGTCEGGLGVGITATLLVDFDVPTQCVQSGLEIVALTGRVNTGTATSFALAQAGAIPPPAGTIPTVPFASAIVGAGPCPTGGTTAVTSRAIPSGAAIVTGTANFFAGLKAPSGGYAGRDTNSPPAGRIWALCPGCSNTQYSPAALTGMGLGGNWMLRVTVEDANCVPVELMELSVS